MVIEDEPIQEDHNPIEDNNREPSVSKQETENESLDQLNENIKEPEKTTNDMETYHPHKIHHDKKFKDYIFEFLMLFLAITGGFFMENMRESYMERHKEKEYIGSLINDIKNDTANIQMRIKYNQRQIKGIDSLIRLLENPIPKINLQKLYEYTATYLNQYMGFTPQDVTITQLKNSGGLRLIEKKSVADNIVNYYTTIDYFHERNEKYNEQFGHDIIKLEMEFLDFNALVTNKWKLYNTTKIKEFQNRAIVFNSCINWDNHWLNDVYNQGSALLKYLKKEYKIKE
jgi:hypothetical protein